MSEATYRLSEQDEERCRRTAGKSPEIIADQIKWWQMQFAEAMSPSAACLYAEREAQAAGVTFDRSTFVSSSMEHSAARFAGMISHTQSLLSGAPEAAKHYRETKTWDR